MTKLSNAEIITLRAIALKPHYFLLFVLARRFAEIITLRAIALKLHGQSLFGDFLLFAEIITLRAIALKRKANHARRVDFEQRS